MTHHLIENTTVSDIELNDMGITVPASGIYDMTGIRVYVIQQSGDLDTNILSGDIKLIKSEGPTVYYTALQASRILRHDVEIILASSGSGDLLSVTSTGDLTWTPVVGGTVAFFNDGATNNKWLKVGDGQVLTSDRAPVILPFDAVIYALTFTNKADNVDVNFEIYKNGTIHYTWTLNGKRWAYKTNGLSAVTFSAGDQMSVFATSSGTSPNNPLIVIHFSFLNANQSEGGSGTL